MADFFLDTNILLRVGDKSNQYYNILTEAIISLKSRGGRAVIVPQNLYEFYVVATRPASARGGLGITPSEAVEEINRLCKLFIFQADTSDIYTEWIKLIDAHQVSGVAAHDARLVAAMIVHGISNLLTFNTVDFSRYNGLTVWHPENI